MKKIWHSWLLFGIFAAAIIAGMGWMSARVVQLNVENAQARRDAWLEESVRNALWQMDAAISPMILEEVSRPYSDYWAFNAQGQVFNVPDDSQVALAQPSPLALTNALGRNLYFQAELPKEKGKKLLLDSPQVIEASLLTQMDTFKDVDVAGNSRQLMALNGVLSVTELQAALEDTAQQEESQTTINSFYRDAPSQKSEDNREVQQVALKQQSGYEYEQRKSGAQQVMKNVQLSKTRLYNWGRGRSQMGNDLASGDIQQSGPDNPAKRDLDGTEKIAIKQITEDVMRPFWVRDLLLLARKVEVGEKETIQGVWLNWDSIKTQLLARVEQTFPAADLVKADPDGMADKSRLMTSLPVMLIPGEPSLAGMPGAASLTLPLTVAWVAVFAGVLAAGALIVGVSMLSERRGAFVSAVTHELRTPLTTFRMYTEMLSEGFVKDEETKQEYISTLHRESERLGHLVENVLAYARLEKGTGSRTLEEVPAGDLLERVREPLRRRADEAGMQLVADVSEEALGVVLTTDVTAVEQILFNLVDNACKYARQAEDKRIHVAAMVSGKELQFKVSDHGEGLRRDELKAVFKPFMKSAEKAAQSAPGVGLGLSLCRRMARQLGGDIRYEDHREYGACFLLKLPVGKG